MKNIDDVISELDAIVTHCHARQSRQAYFAALYRAMTVAVKNGLSTGVFEDAARMEKLDIIFAKRYIDAWHCYQQNQACSGCWKAAFDACENGNLIVLQHLLLGINAHINLDLCIAAAETCPGEAISGLQNDFGKINQLIASLTGVVQSRLEKLWWPMKFLSQIANGREKAVIGFSIDNARRASWSSAVGLATISGPAADRYKADLDKTVSTIAAKIIRPASFSGVLLSIIRWFEFKDISRTIDILNEPVA